VRFCDSVQACGDPGPVSHGLVGAPSLAIFQLKGNRCTAHALRRGMAGSTRWLHQPTDFEMTARWVGDRWEKLRDTDSCCRVNYLIC
jgi:hypothetical protein